ncbi:MAG: L,D-transpeptidase family protein [Gammaproteobacteria bacterium]|nr:L,D-transpeptidase family protein [Gammaproteobacteria bacterium]MDP2142173.1 L,D-transpeptidase family protein [Gammaproteobacteria bacterium]MDP2348219.1 L,D-transpeptidase family protein [Gammaproteobacteria bacterium]
MKKKVLKISSRRNFSLWIFFLAALAPPELLAQAGAFPAISLESGNSSSLHNLIESGEGGSGRLEAIAEPQRPEGILKLADGQRYLIWVELQRGRLNVMEKQDNGGLVTRKIIPISIGKNGYGKEVEGDKLTPVGVYRLTSYLDDNTLDDFYGRGAYPLNYPNAHDRLLKRTGHGIWLHGLPKDQKQRPLLDSDGCVVVDNATLQELANYIQTGATHIVLSEGDIKWSPVQNFKEREAALASAFEDWRLSWQEIDNTGYLSHYADDFHDLINFDKAAWSRYKSRVNNAKSYIKVDISQASFIADPRDEALVTVRFYQNYQSSNHNWTGWKEQLWQETDDGWKILYEGNG